MNSLKSSETMKTSTHGSVPDSSLPRTWTNSQSFTTVVNCTASKGRRILTMIRNAGEWLLFVALLPVLIVVLIVTYEREPND